MQVLTGEGWRWVEPGCCIPNELLGDAHDATGGALQRSKALRLSVA